jgi:hypothetical protein
MDLLPHIKFTRDDKGNRIYNGKRANYRVIDDHGIRLVEIHPLEGITDAPDRDDSADVLLGKLNECKAYIDGIEDLGHPDLAYQLALLARHVKG